MKRPFFLFLILTLLILFEIARVYFIMPFPGSQLGLDGTSAQAALKQVELAYWLHTNGGWLRALGLLLLVYPTLLVLSKPRRTWQRYVAVLLLIAYGGVLYMVNQEMMADHMFLQPKHKQVVPLSQNKIPLDKLVLGFATNGQAAAYPIQLIGYHHQVRDTVGGQSIMVTYCTVCRTGRVFSPIADGKTDEFRLVGMDHFNAMFEDKHTGSWWRQATGEAIVGPLRGKALPELSARQMTLREWAAEHPNTRVLQADSTFTSEFAQMKNYERGLSKGKLTRRDSASWQPKSWVIGVETGNHAKAFDWNQLQEKRIISDTVGSEPVLVAMSSDNVSFGVWNRRINSKLLTFHYVAGQLIDLETHSHWTWRGRSISGPLAGTQLTVIPNAHQEFWHSWHSFHPDTDK
ncbi:hypothetical protein GCM10027592_47340 [Spirosoma flavus]